MTNLYDIKVENGKYNMIITEDFQVKVLRHGEEWMDIDKGSKFFIALMYKFEAMEEALKFYADSKTYNGEYIDCGKDGVHTSTPVIYTDQGYKAKEVLSK